MRVEVIADPSQSDTATGRDPAASVAWQVLPRKCKRDNAEQQTLFFCLTQLRHGGGAFTASWAASYHLP